MVTPFNDSEGLQVSYNDSASKAPEVVSGQNISVSYTPSENHEKQPRVPFGLGIWTFGILIAIITAVVVGGGVGGGLGAALANCRTCNIPTTDSDAVNDTSTKTDLTDYQPVSPEKIEKLALKCPEDVRTGAEFKSSRGYDFKYYCGIDAVSRSAAEEGGIIADIAPIVAYTLDDCIDACASVIERNKGDGTGTICASVLFTRLMAENYNKYSANCWLKNGTKARGSSWESEGEDYAYAEFRGSQS